MLGWPAKSIESGQSGGLEMANYFQFRQDKG